MVRRVVPPLVVVVLAGCACGDDGADPARRATGDAASAAREIASPAGSGSGEPFLSVAADGRLLMSWLEPDGPATALRFAERGSGGWSEPRTIARGDDWFVNWADFPSLIELPGGDLVAHWLRRTGPETYAYEVAIARSSDGGRTWSEPVVPHDDATPTEHGFVTLFPADGGAVTAVWLDGRKYASDGAPPTDEMTLRAARIDPAGRVFDETLLDGRVCDCCQTDVALTSEGQVVVYRDRSAAEIRDIAAVGRTAGGWDTPSAVHDDGWEIAACPVNGPAAAAAGRRVAVAWFTAAGGEPRVRVAFSDDAGTTFGPARNVDDGDPVGRVDLVPLPGGETAVSWLERDGDRALLLARRVGPAGAGAAVRIAVASHAREGGFPRMAAIGDSLVFAWTDPSADRIRVAVLPAAALDRPETAGDRAAR